MTLKEHLPQRWARIALGVLFLATCVGPLVYIAGKHAGLWP